MNASRPKLSVPEGLVGTPAASFLLGGSPAQIVTQILRGFRCCADAFIRDTVHSGNANVGTCTMAAAAGGNAVVDPSLRVFGVRGLRVADASVIPVIPGEPGGNVSPQRLCFVDAP